MNWPGVGPGVLTSNIGWSMRSKRSGSGFSPVVITTDGLPQRSLLGVQPHRNVTIFVSVPLSSSGEFSVPSVAAKELRGLKVRSGKADSGDSEIVRYAIYNLHAVYPSISSVLLQI